MPVQCAPSAHAQAVVHHPGLGATFYGIQHPTAPAIEQFRGIKYATIPARFRRSRLWNRFPPQVDASRYGPVCPQLGKKSTEEELFSLGCTADMIPHQSLEQNEFECLSLNITCPAGLDAQSRIPVMLWVHGGGDRGYGSSWIYDGASIVGKSVSLGKPVMVVTFNFRIGLFGFAASPALLEDNRVAGESGVGNYGRSSFAAGNTRGLTWETGLHDQRTAMEWVHRYIEGFGGDPDNVTLFGESSGGSDILSHLLSKANEHAPMFHRAIVQSAVADHNAPDVHTAGWHISRVMSILDVSSVEQLRAVSAEKLVKTSGGSTLRAVDDGHFFVHDWRSHYQPEERHRPRRTSRSRSRARPHRHQPLIIGDTCTASLMWSLPASLWTSHAVVRRLNAICQSVTKAADLLSAYDIGVNTPDDEIVDRVLELVGDARVSWPMDCFAARARHGRGVWQYVFDQDAPARIGHKADLAYLFDTLPQPVSPAALDTASATGAVDFCDSFDLDDDDDLHDRKFDSDEEDEGWIDPPVDEWAYTRVRDSMQERWIHFANGHEPWKHDHVFVFGPEAEVGERSRHIFEGRRRKAVWREALEPLGMSLVQKIGMELSRGPPLKGSGKY
ncbi:unnamed protein product [Mycena citricolor]|uniref:Carboxylic ester hydrolase n=1 Tax=Mycena citricolor TaxID=2018698 RepID=A0AAD2HC01_9AGAR|nr:unnamed protein product [Mycena citricolor]